ncbi:MAG: Hsp20/alpha crystallin family protein, partial [Acidobacteria bacterium]|nr:Hsp20/alpha crystallin family protein [Acidobacteriota bacterium]
DTLVLKVELPGVAPDKLCLSVHGGNVILRGEKARPSAEGAVEFHTAERQFGRFKRVIQLGVPVNTRLATAELSNGLLEVRFPKVPNRRGEEVPIEITGK